MKKEIIALVFLIGCLTTFTKQNLKGQTGSISVISMAGVDTVLADSIIPINIIIQNSDPSFAYTGSITVLAGNSNTGQFLIDTLYSDTTLQYIQPNLGNSNIGTNHTFRTTTYANGDNIVVVWPILNPTLNFTTDTTTFNMHIVYPNTVAELEKHGIKIYPNPLRDKLTIKPKPDITINQVRIFDAAGRQMIESQNSFDLDVSTLPKGTYLLFISTKNGKNYSSIVVKE
ncbi:MAG: hypothetical protein RIQ89_1847 [Bacteroidota bacterium]|jgi:hypothetical protein